MPGATREEVPGCKWLGGPVASCAQEATGRWSCPPRAGVVFAPEPLAGERNAKLVCSTFGVSRATLYRWRKRFDPRDLPTLQERTRRPRRVRQPTWSPELVKAVLQLREQYPRWGKAKLAVLLRREGLVTSVSTVGRILADLKRRRLLVEPRGKVVSAKRRRARRPYATRKPKGYVPGLPGDLVQVDTLELSPLPG